MNCRKCKIEIEDRDLRRESLSDAATAHVAACASCRVFGEERLALRRLVGGLEKVSAPADFDFRLRARLAAGRSEGAARATRFNFSPATLSWPLAGCLALVVSASLYFQSQRSEPPATPAVTEQARAASTMPSPLTPVAEVASQNAAASGSETGRAVPLNDETRHSVDAAAPKNSLAQRRRVVPARFAGREDIVNEPVRGEESTSTGLLGSTPRFAAGGAARGESALIPVQLDAPEGQLKVLLRDTSGTARTISVDSVSFGSRDVMGRPGATYTRASLTSNQGVW
jgi:hypothetical protein